MLSSIAQPLLVINISTFSMTNHIEIKKSTRLKNPSENINKIPFRDLFLYQITETISMSFRYGVKKNKRKGVTFLDFLQLLKPSRGNKLSRKGIENIILLCMFTAVWSRSGKLGDLPLWYIILYMPSIDASSLSWYLLFSLSPSSDSLAFWATWLNAWYAKLTLTSWLEVAIYSQVVKNTHLKKHELKALNCEFAD